MEEEFSSWIRRTKFSHTVCHRVNSFGLASLPLTIDEERISRLGALPGRDSSSSNQSGKSSASVGSPVRSSPVRFSTKKSASFATQDEKSPVQSGMKKSASFASVPLSIDEERTSRLGGSLPGRDSFSSNQTAKNSTSVASRFQNSPVRSSMKKLTSFASQDQKSPVCSSMKKSASFASIPVSVDEERISQLGGLLSGRDSSSSNQIAKNSTSVASRFRNSPVRSSTKKLTSFTSEDQKSPVCSSVKKSASFASIPVSVDEQRISQLGGSLSGRDSSSNQTARNSTSVASRFQNSPVHSSTKKSASFASQVQNSPVRSSTKKSASFAGHDQESPVGSNTQIQRNPGMNKQRSMSPLPTTELSDTFREARSERKRFSTPLRGRVSSRDTSPLKLFSRDTSPFKGKLFDRDTSPLRHLTSWKGREKSKIKKECSWIKYFDNGGGKINAVGAADEFTVDMSQLFLGLRFAHGAHSRLYHGVYKDETVAVKMIRVPDDDETGTLAVRLGNQYEREVTLLSRLHHPNVIKFVAACRKPPVYCIITEYLSEGSLRAYLHKLEHKVLPLQKLIAMALDIARGLEYIHSEGVIHRDLKPENILINKDFQMKLADFGIACEEAYCDSLADDPGTYRWMAPEMIKKKPYGRKVDVYSFGLILWEMVAGTIPYEDMNPIQAAFAVVNKNLRPVVPVTCPPAMKALIEQCWSLQPEKRPEFWQIIMVLEQFESSLASDGTLNLVQNPLCQDHKKGLLHWIQKLTPAHPVSPTPKPKFL